MYVVKYIEFFKSRQKLAYFQLLQTADVCFLD